MAAMPGRADAPTSFDVASRAGVSQSTVSLVLSGKAQGRVGAATREAVLRAARELGYQRNSAGRSLRLGRSNTLAYVVPDVTRPFYPYTLVGAESAARAHDYSVVLINAGGGAWRQLVADWLRSGRIDGILLHHSDVVLDGPIAEYAGRVVVLDAQLETAPSVATDHRQAVRRVLTHLLDLGHTRIAYLASPEDIPHGRFESFRGESARPGRVFDVDFRRASGWSVSDSRRAALRLLRAAPRPTAVVCHNELLAPGVYKAARELGLHIPDDLSVVGFGDFVVAQALEPELTTVAIPNQEMGAAATELLISVVEGSEQPAPTHLTLMGQLRVRGSTAPATVRPSA